MGHIGLVVTHSHAATARRARLDTNQNCQLSPDFTGLRRVGCLGRESRAFFTLTGYLNRSLTSRSVRHSCQIRGSNPGHEHAITTITQSSLIVPFLLHSNMPQIRHLKIHSAQSSRLMTTHLRPFNGLSTAKSVERPPLEERLYFRPLPLLLNVRSRFTVRTSREKHFFDYRLLTVLGVLELRSGLPFQGPSPGLPASWLTLDPITSYVQAVMIFQVQNIGQSGRDSDRSQRVAGRPAQDSTAQY